jgi:lipopolysaccharide/colanic/teichoic acid biosynthesis glycosyltransferase
VTTLLEHEHALKRRSGWPLNGAAKRGIDVVVAALLLVVLVPLILVVAGAIKLDSPGPVFFRARRAGYRGMELRMVKFRKMRDDAAGPALTRAEDVRFTRVGRLLAKTKLDELPQLWNVLIGEMSLVGPRPEDPRFVALEASAYETILRVRPGITGLCQLAFARESEVLDEADPTRHYVERLLPQKAQLDALYAERRSLRMDLAILFWTILAVCLRRPVAVNRQTASLTLRRRRRAAQAPLVSDRRRVSV